MRKNINIFIIIFSLTGALAWSTVYAGNALTSSNDLTPRCNKPGAVPRAVTQLDNYNIVTKNTGIISTSDVFIGNDLHYSVKAEPSNTKNTVFINGDTGVMHVRAGVEDNFDVTVSAKNSCGSASIKFNIQIDKNKG